MNAYLQRIGFAFLAAALPALAVGTLAAADATRLQRQADVVLPSPSGRFDYAARDPQTGHLWLNQMGADRVLVFDPKARRVVGIIHGLSAPTGITLAPRRRLAFIRNAGSDRMVVVNLDTRKIVKQLPAGRFPDGSAWIATTERLFVSDEHGGSETVIATRPLRREATIPLGGEAGMSVYDARDGWVLVNVQTRNQLVAIDPQTLKIAHRWTMPPSCRHNHGLLLDPKHRRAFIACDGNARLLVLSLPDMRLAQPPLVLGRRPDVLALDARRGWLIWPPKVAWWQPLRPAAGALGRTPTS